MCTKKDFFSAFQICIEGTCSPFHPDDVEKPKVPDIDDNSVDEERDASVEEDSHIYEPLDIVDGRPAWYDPIFTDMFIELKSRYVSEPS